jgi:hypothetical protein
MEEMLPHIVPEVLLGSAKGSEILRHLTKQQVAVCMRWWEGVYNVAFHPLSSDCEG